MTGLLSRRRLLRKWGMAALVIAVVGCAHERTGTTTASPPVTASSRPALPAPVEPPASASVQLVSQEQFELMPNSHETSELVQPGVVMAESVGTYPINMETALQLAAGRNPQVAFARERWRESLAGVDAADVLWLPSLNAGVNWNKHEGAIQDVVGDQIDTSRGAFYGGLGAGAVGAASPAMPGLVARFHLAEAWFEPLAARQQATARARATAAVNNDVLLDAAVGYLELLRASQELNIARQTEADARQLADLTAAFARSGQGLQADADRALAELMLRENGTLRAEESLRVASARLAQILRLDPTVQLEPLEPALVPVDLVPPGADVNELVATGLSFRPELAAQRALVAEAITRWRRQRLATLIPSVMLGTSYGGFGAGTGSFIGGPDDRFDVDAMAWGEIRNLGFGEAAARDASRSQVRQATVQQVAVMDQVAREVSEAHAQVEFRRQQVAVARRGVQAAIESHERNLNRIRDAIGLPIEALQSIQALDAARRDALRSLIDYDVAQFQLQRAIGWPGG